MNGLKFNNVTPESQGVSSKVVLDALKTLDGYNLYTHSILMARGDNIFTEASPRSKQ